MLMKFLNGLLLVDQTDSLLFGIDMSLKLLLKLFVHLGVELVFVKPFQGILAGKIETLIESLWAFGLLIGKELFKLTVVA